MKNFIYTIGLLIMTAMTAHAQESTETSSRKNTVKIDLTSHLFFSKALVLSYERVIKPYQTLVVTAGYQQFQPFSNFGANIIVTDDRSATGLKLGADYRFYLQKENKYTAPRGVYIGPYLSYLNFNNTRELEIDNNGTPETAELTTNLNIINIGFQLGYQFVIKDRWTIDMVFVGPSVSNYRINMDLKGSYTGSAEDIQNEIITKLIDRFPAFEDLINDKSVSGSGKTNSWAYGYRYQLQVGYRFGGKKK